MKKLTVTTNGPDQIVMTREFAAPRELVIEAMTTPKLIERWLGGDRATVVSAEVDARPGGRYRYVLRAHHGHQFAFGGVFVELGADRIVQRETMDGYPSETTVTTTFAEANGKTAVRIVVACESQQVRDAILASGMEHGAAESYDKLEALVTR